MHFESKNESANRLTHLSDDSAGATLHATASKSVSTGPSMGLHAVLRPCTDRQGTLNLNGPLRPARTSLIVFVAQVTKKQSRKRCALAGISLWCRIERMQTRSKTKGRDGRMSLHNKAGRGQHRGSTDRSDGESAKFSAHPRSPSWGVTDQRAGQSFSPPIAQRRNSGIKPVWWGLGACVSLAIWYGIFLLI